MHLSLRIEASVLGGGASAFAIVGTLIAALIVGVITLAEPVREFAESAPEIGRRVEAKLPELRGPTTAVIEAGKRVDELASVREPGLLSSFMSVAPTAAAQAALTLVLLLFLLASGARYRRRPEVHGKGWWAVGPSGVCSERTPMKLARPGGIRTPDQARYSP
jgi:predicted PurR-regulated permease PerM